MSQQADKPARPPSPPRAQRRHAEKPDVNELLGQLHQQLALKDTLPMHLRRQEEEEDDQAALEDALQFRRQDDEDEDVWQDAIATLSDQAFANLEPRDPR